MIKTTHIDLTAYTHEELAAYTHKELQELGVAVYADLISSPVRKLGAKAELYKGSALIDTFSYEDALKEFSIERVGEESKFFGFGICQKLSLKLIDVNRELNITTENSFDIQLGLEENYLSPYPRFYVTEVNRDENTNELSITAYDALTEATRHVYSELGLTSYTIFELVTACANLLGECACIELLNVDESAFSTYYESGANFEGTETIRDVLTAIAEATQCVYYISNIGLTFKRYDKDGEPALIITKEDCFTLNNKENKRLSKIVSATELGDNVGAELSISGSTQYVRDNPFWELREDVAQLVSNALAAVGGLTICQFDCSWRGNFLLEIGDKIALVTKDDELIYSYVVNDVISYNGFLSESTGWNYTDNESETEDNPTTLGEALKQTFARVDKANKQIELVASEVSATSAAISSLQINTDAVSASVQKISEETAEMNESISELTQSVAATITAEDVQIAIESELANGVDSVKTKTGYTFNEEGLTIEKTGSEMKTLISDDGMKVYKNDEETLTADNTGVKAKNLHATTYLIIGTNSRFEDFDGDRTGCFYIGG